MPSDNNEEKLNSEGSPEIKPVPENAMRRALKNDVLGVDEWKRSKIGFLLGYGPARKAAATLGHSVVHAQARMGLLYETLKGSVTRHVPELEHPEKFENASVRFSAAMRAQHVSQNDLTRIQRNTMRGTYMYLLVSVLFVIATLISLAIYPSSGLTGVGRLGPTPLFLALAFRNAFTNWCVRHKLATGPMAFLKSGDWWPR